MQIVFILCIFYLTSLTMRLSAVHELSDQREMWGILRIPFL